MTSQQAEKKRALSCVQSNCYYYCEASDLAGWVCCLWTCLWGRHGVTNRLTPFNLCTLWNEVSQLTWTHTASLYLSHALIYSTQCYRLIDQKEFLFFFVSPPQKSSHLKNYKVYALIDIQNSYINNLQRHLGLIWLRKLNKRSAGIDRQIFGGANKSKMWCLDGVRIM